ncbi:hypothetical protein [Fibrobacter sp.]|uniref:hypothetical protein n=1 Tax=Fibrobacter sp. TaxID=35828 RepID=UPI0038686E75
MNPKKKKIMITAIALSVLFILGDAGVLFLSQEKFGHVPRGERLERIKKFCLSKHSCFEPLKNAKKAAQESGKPVLMPQIGEVVYLE